jgi:hypothetical protein
MQQSDSVIVEINNKGASEIITISEMIGETKNSISNKIGELRYREGYNETDCYIYNANGVIGYENVTANNTHFCFLEDSLLVGYHGFLFFDDSVSSNSTLISMLERYNSLNVDLNKEDNGKYYFNDSSVEIVLRQGYKFSSYNFHIYYSVEHKDNCCDW